MGELPPWQEFLREVFSHTEVPLSSARFSQRGIIPPSGDTVSDSQVTTEVELIFKAD